MKKEKDINNINMETDSRRLSLWDKIYIEVVYWNKSVEFEKIGGFKGKKKKRRVKRSC